MADLYLKDPKTNEIVVFDEADAQAAANAGYQQIDQATYARARQAEAQASPTQAAASGLLQPAEADPSAAFAEKVYSGLTFGQGEQIRTPAAIARGRQYQEEHPYAAGAAEMLGQVPYTLMGGVAGAGLRGAAAGAGALARAGAFAGDVALNAAVGGAQIEGEETRLTGENFSFTDAAIAGVTAEVMGRGAAWGVSKAVGGARNLIQRAARDAVAADAERSLSRGGWVGDYRVAQHAERYTDELADLGARDLDTLEQATAEVSRQDRKRARIVRAVVDNPAAQHEVNVQALEGLQRLRSALEGELAEAPGGPAKRLAKQLDERIAALNEAPKGRKLWRILDENRQALQEYRQDLHQAYDSNPGSAWLSREGLAAIDAAEEQTRNALLREDVWGEAAARMQREYNVPFHEKWFPARKTVLADLHFATGKDAQGFTVYRGEPAKLRKFLASLGGTSPDTHRARELFGQYLDGAEAIARAGERDAPKAAREALESIRRLRKNLSNSTFINSAVERNAARGAVAGVAGAAVAGAAGLAIGGPLGGAGGVMAARTVRLGHWFTQAAERLGLFKGDLESMAELLAKDALPEARAGAEALTERLSDDLADAPFPKAASARPPGPGGPLVGERGVTFEGSGPKTQRPEYRIGERRDANLKPGFKDTRPNPGADVLPEGFNVHGEPVPERPSALPGVGQARRAAADRPAGMEALQPQPRPVDVGPPAAGYTPDERPTLQNLERTGTERPGAGEGYRRDPRHWADDKRAEIARTPTRPPARGRGWEPLPPPSGSEFPSVREGTEPPARGGGGWAVMEPPREGASVRGESELPSLREGSEAAPASLLDEGAQAERAAFAAETRPTPPLRQEGLEYYERAFAPGAEARAAEAARLQALTEDEFAHVVDGLNATGQKASDGSPLGDFLAKHVDDLKTAGLVVAGGGVSALAAEYEGQDGLAGASAGVLGAAALLSGRKLGMSQLLGGRFSLSSAGRREAESIVANALDVLPRAPEVDLKNVPFFGDVAGGRFPEVRKLMDVSAKAAQNLEESEQHAISEWVASSANIRHEQRTGLTAKKWVSNYAADFESAMDKLTVVDPTKHGTLYRHMDLDDAALADLLTRDEFVAGAHMSTGYVPDTDFGPHQLRFEKVDAAGALIGANPAESEMVIPKDARFRVTGRYADPETGNFVFTLEEVPTTRESFTKDVGVLAIPAVGIGASAIATGGDDGSAEDRPAGASAGFLGAAVLFKQARAKLVSDVAKRLFSPTVGRAVARLAARQVYTRSEMAKRQQEFQSWQENPQELVDRVAEGFRDVPPEQQPATNAGVFRAANFLKARLPSITKINSLSMRDIPVSTEQLHKFARYEDAALRPRDAWADAASRGHISPELLETTEELYPDLLAELRVGAYLQVREEGPPVTVQARLQYAKLFDGRGEFADPSMSPTVASMSAMAYEAAVPPKPGGGPAGTSGGVSHTAAAVSAPAGMARLG